jgi:K+-transporting ATPase ATPase A chain
MSTNGLIQVGVYLLVLIALSKPLGVYMAAVYAGQSAANRWLQPLEGFIYRICGVAPEAEMRWTEYASAMLIFNLLGLVAVYSLQRLQVYLPLNPQELPNVTPDSAFNTAASFVTNTNWQGYSGEATLSYLTQMLGLGVQNFLSAATGMAVLVAMIRGFKRMGFATIGNFWVDLNRSILYVLMPLSLLLAMLLIGQGVVQTFSPYASVPLLQSAPYSTHNDKSRDETVADPTRQAATERDDRKIQTLALGPAASQIAIKQLGTNGGGYFNVNSAHPFENPTPLSNLLEMLAILLIPAALCHTFGAMVGDRRQGWAILAAMTLVFTGLAIFTAWAEQSGNPLIADLPVEQAPGDQQPGGNMEGKELRFGIVNSALWATATTAAANGSVNAMHDSFTPLGGMMPLWLMQLGEVIFGGVGSGLYGMLVFALVAVFVAGLMIGRTPEYLGKKIEAFEMKMAALVILVPPCWCLAGRRWP